MKDVAAIVFVIIFQLEIRSEKGNISYSISKALVVERFNLCFKRWNQLNIFKHDVPLPASKGGNKVLSRGSVTRFFGPQVAKSVLKNRQIPEEIRQIVSKSYLLAPQFGNETYNKHSSCITLNNVTAYLRTILYSV